MAKKNLTGKWRVTSATKHNRIPMNLQFFAEPGGPGAEENPAGGGESGGADPAGDNGGGESGGGEVTLESVMAELATLKAENAKLKSTNDKLCQSEGQLRKQLRAKMTAEEEAAEVKAEEEAAHKEYVSGLEKELAIIKSTAKFIEMGFDAETAAATATADYDGDKETVNANIKKMMAAQRKQMEAELREKLLKEIPAPQSGNQTNVDYSKQINDALNAGDAQAAALAILNQAQAVGQSQ